MFTHLHVHTQYSVLDGASAISDLFATAKADGQKALAITDHFRYNSICSSNKSYCCL